MKKLDTIPDLRVDSVIHRGNFEVLAVSAGDERYCFKRPLAEGVASYGATTSCLFSRLWSINSRSGEVESPLSASTVLQEEARRIEQTGGAWNHHVILEGVMKLRGVGEAEASYGLLTPLRGGPTFAELPVERQRRHFISTLPAMWDALCVSWHGDLHPANIVFWEDMSHFSLIDPGICLVSHEGFAEDGTSLTFVTNAHHYPLLPPYAVNRPAARANSEVHLKLFIESLSGVIASGPMRGTSDVVVSAGGKARFGPSSSGETPSAADMMALGVMYYELLTGAHPLYDETFTEPAWVGGRNSDNPSRPFGWGFERSLERLSRGVVMPRARNPDVSVSEERLALALLDGRIASRAQLMDHALPLYHKFTRVSGA